jgi:Fe-S-cluster containining protein
MRRFNMNLFRTKRVKRHGILLDKPVDGSERCKDCDADCCRGFPSVRLTAEEYSTLERLGAARLEFLLNGEHYLIIEHGCEFLADNQCSIYDQRPEICRRFTCNEI